MRAKVVSAPAFSVRTSMAPDSSTVPANTADPSCLSLGTLSPVIGASLTAPLPEDTCPSTGTFSPARTRTTFPGRS